MPLWHVFLQTVVQIWIRGHFSSTVPAVSNEHQHRRNQSTKLQCALPVPSHFITSKLGCSETHSFCGQVGISNIKNECSSYLVKYWYSTALSCPSWVQFCRQKLGSPETSKPGYEEDQVKLENLGFTSRIFIELSAGITAGPETSFIFRHVHRMCF